MPGTVGGAFVVDYLGPKYTMVLFLHDPPFNVNLTVLGTL
jgi:hypothetical protein